MSIHRKPNTRAQSVPKQQIQGQIVRFSKTSENNRLLTSSIQCTIRYTTYELYPEYARTGSSGRTCALGAYTWQSVRVSVTGHVQWFHPSDPPKLAQHTVSDNLCERWVITRVTRTNSRKFSPPMLETFVAPLGLDEYHRPTVLP